VSLPVLSVFETYLVAERAIAERLLRLANGTLPWPWIDPNKALPWVEERIGLALAAGQVAAIRFALRSKVLVMTGGPGVGKTTIVKGILRILAAKTVRLLLCAPTDLSARYTTTTRNWPGAFVVQVCDTPSAI
jgi:exodeoxyribonuclease V alpha subunit